MNHAIEMGNIFVKQRGLQVRVRTKEGSEDLKKLGNGRTQAKPYPSHKSLHCSRLTHNLDHPFPLRFEVCHHQ